ncbi:hypothetical protein SDC9_123680 [bioreactor metagenome]|uniref:Uncharacterized protein n=1 Tax=bioreactor metagenome TaxID=1076179 RepID=A0A645CIA3_9ZZZZ
MLDNLVKIAPEEILHQFHPLIPGPLQQQRDVPHDLRVFVQLVITMAVCQKTNDPRNIHNIGQFPPPWLEPIVQIGNRNKKCNRYAIIHAELPNAPLPNPKVYVKMLQ